MTAALTYLAGLSGVQEAIWLGCALAAGFLIGALMEQELGGRAWRRKLGGDVRVARAVGRAEGFEEGWEAGFAVATQAQAVVLRDRERVRRARTAERN